MLAFISERNSARRLLEHLGFPPAEETPLEKTGPPEWTFVPVELEL